MIPPEWIGLCIGILLPCYLIYDQYKSEKEEEEEIKFDGFPPYDLD